MKKILSIILCLTLVLGLAIAVSADDTKTATLSMSDFTETTVYDNGTTETRGDISFTFSYCALRADSIRVYKSSTLVISAASGYKITGITYEELEGNELSINGTVEGGTLGAGVITDINGDVTITASGKQVRLSSITVTYEAVSGGSSTEGTEGTTAPTTTPTTEALPTWSRTASLVTELTDGAQIVLNNASSVVTGTEYTYTSSSGNSKQELVLSDASVEGNTLSYNEAIVLTVELNGDYVSFKTADGKYLYADNTDVKYVSEAGDNTLFVLEAAENGYYIKCANAVYVSSDGTEKAQYLEIYSGYLTVYSFNESKADIYTFNFYAPSSTTGGNAGTGDSISVIVALLAVSAVGAAVILKKKEF